MHIGKRNLRAGLAGLSLVVVMLIGSQSSFARDKYETIDAQAFGTGTQMGQTIGITVTIYDFSTAADRQILMAVGHIAITGTLGYDLSFIKLIQTPTGRKIRFVTNRQIRFGEAFFDTQSQNFNLTAGEIDLNDQDKSKSAGQLFPAAQLIIDKEGQLQLDLNQNAWRLGGIIDWKGTPGEN